MVRWMGCLTAAAILTSFLTTSRPAMAETLSKLPVAVIMVVDVQEAIQQSAAGRTIRSQRDAYVHNLQSSSDAARRSLKEAEAELLRQKAALSPEAWQQKARFFEQQVFEFNQKYQKNSQAIEKSFHIAMQELSAALAKVTEDVASDMGATIVLPKSQIFLHDPRMEQTAVVIERFNRKYPSLPFPAPALDGEDAGKNPVKKK